MANFLKEKLMVARLWLSGAVRNFRLSVGLALLPKDVRSTIEKQDQT